MPLFRVNLELPPGSGPHVYVDAPDAEDAKRLVTERIKDLELTQYDDRILYDCEEKDPFVVDAAPASPDCTEEAIFTRFEWEVEDA